MYYIANVHCEQSYKLQELTQPFDPKLCPTIFLTMCVKTKLHTQHIKKGNLFEKLT